MLRRSRFYSFVVAITAATLLASCGIVRVGQRGLKAARPSVKPQKTADSIDVNTRQRLAYFYQMAMTQQAAGNIAEAYSLLSYCRRICPTAAEAHFSLSRYDEALNSKAMADDDIRRAVELSPDNRIYKEYMASSYLKDKNFVDAIPVYEDIYKQQPDRTDILELLVGMYDKVGDNQSVVSTIERLENADGESEQTVFSKMRAYSKMGKKKDEFNTLKRFVDKYPNDPNYQVLLGNWLLNNGGKQQALSILSKVLKQDPDNLGAQLTMLDYYNEENLDSTAYNLKMKLLRSDKTPVDTKVQIIRQVIAKNESEGADSTKVLALFDDILSAPQKTKDMLEVYAAYLTIKNMPDSSIVSVYKKILDIAPDYTTARVEILRRLKMPEDNDEIAKYCKSGIEYTPSELVYYYFLGFVYMQQDKPDDAYDVYVKGVEQTNDKSEPALVSDMYEYIANTLYERGEHEAAYEAFDKALQWKEDNVEVLNNYAYFLSESDGDLSKAEHMSYLTVKAEPKNSLYLDTYAWILFRQERYSEAQIYIDQAIENDTTKSSVLLGHGGDIYFKLGNVDKAVDLWKQAREAGDDSAVLEQKIRRRVYIPESGK